MAYLTKLRLPHPYFTTYEVLTLEEQGNNAGTLQILRGKSNKSTLKELEPPEILHTADLCFTTPQPSHDEEIPVTNNTAWARARRAPHSEFQWTTTAPSIGQIWLATYALFTVRPEIEEIRISLEGPGHEKVVQQIIASMLAIAHPINANDSKAPGTDEVLLQRGSFWQGAGSPFGEAAVWTPRDTSKLTRPFILHYTLTTKFPQERVHTWHPQRAEKPAPGSVIYSRYIPHLDEQFSMVALDHQNNEHLNLFHTWQNDPRVAQGWNESGTLEQHYGYLERMHNDPHQIAILAYFESTPFAYFEVYWAKEDHLGAYYPAGDFDRGRHSLVGDKRYRGRHRVTAWWSSLMHYLFLDDPRTMRVVGEPKIVNTSVLEYDLMAGFSVDKFVDLPHKRSAFMVCNRERFFQLSPLDAKGGYVGGTNIVIAARL